jgi:hypothetical protein
MSDKDSDNDRESEVRGTAAHHLGVFEELNGVVAR